MPSVVATTLPRRVVISIDVDDEQSPPLPVTTAPENIGGTVWFTGAGPVQIGEAPVVFHFDLADGSYITEGLRLSFAWHVHPPRQPRPSDPTLAPGTVTCTVPGSLLGQDAPAWIIARSLTGGQEINGSGDFFNEDGIGRTVLTVTGGAGFAITCTKELFPNHVPLPVDVTCHDSLIAPGAPRKVTVES